MKVLASLRVFKDFVHRKAVAPPPPPRKLYVTHLSHDGYCWPKIYFEVKSFILKVLMLLLLLGVSNGHSRFLSARSIWSLLDLLAKFRRAVLACSCLQNFAIAQIL